MSAQFFSIVQLLEKTGFVLRGATRADCIHCQGHSRGTVAFTTEVAFCRRCEMDGEHRHACQGRRSSSWQLHRGDRDTRLNSTQCSPQFKLQRFDTWRQKQVRMV